MLPNEYNAPVNPNVAKSKPRRGPRPKSKNTPSSTNPSTLNWIEPLPYPVNVDLDFQQHHEHIPAAKFVLTPELPATIAHPYMEALAGDLFRNTGEEELAERIIPYVEALSYFKVCQQLYITYPPEVKTLLQPYKSVFYDTLEVPKSMSNLIGSLGNFNSKLGEFRIKYPVTAFMRYLCTGISKIQAHDGCPPINHHSQPQTWIWRNREGYDILHNLATERLKAIRDVTHVLEVVLQQPAEEVDYDVEPITLTSHPIHASFPRFTAHSYHSTTIFGEEARREYLLAGLLTELTLSDFLNPAYRSPLLADSSIDDMINELLEIRFADQSFTNNAIISTFVTFQTQYVSRALPHIRSRYAMSPPPKSEEGSASQLVSSKDMALRSMFPLSDGDIGTGFLMNPLEALTFEPSIVAYTRQTRSSALASLASVDSTSPP
jgi:hypothetical protein